MATIGKHRKQLSEKEEKEKNELCVKVISAIDFFSTKIRFYQQILAK